jgi:hypothetical protein
VIVVAIIAVAIATYISLSSPSGPIAGAPTAVATGVLVSTPSATAAAPASALPVDTAEYLAQLDALDASSAYVDGYERDAFGSGWKDPDGNGCDARNDILARDLTALTFKDGTHDCVVLSGTLDDPYTGTVIAFTRGNDTSTLVQIDHIVPLSWSWSHGAAAWTDEQRLAFANDPANLRAVDGATNGSKSDSGPGEWLPPDATFACGYVESFVTVLATYDLSIDDVDRVAIRGILLGCS